MPRLPDPFWLPRLQVAAAEPDIDHNDDELSRRRPAEPVDPVTEARRERARQQYQAIERQIARRAQGSE
jgi:hypothetical protein